MKISVKFQTFTRLGYSTYESASKIVAFVQIAFGFFGIPTVICFGFTKHHFRPDEIPVTDKFWEYALYTVLGSSYYIGMGILLLETIRRKSLMGSRYWTGIAFISLIASVVAQSIILETEDSLIPFQLKGLTELGMVVNMFMVYIGAGYQDELRAELENFHQRLPKPRINEIRICTLSSSNSGDSQPSSATFESSWSESSETLSEDSGISFQGIQSSGDSCINMPHL